MLLLLFLASLVRAQGPAESNSPPAAADNPVTETNASSAEESTAFELKQLSVEQLMDVEVTSVTRSPEKLADSPSAIQVITGDEIHRSAAASIPEALRLADNLEVAQENSHDWAISARGFNTQLANKLLVLMDGRTIYSPLFSGVFWNVQDYLLEDLDRIEVISGPGGTLWGANAVNGVISIVSENAVDTQGLYVEGGGGSELRDFAGVRYGGALTSNVFYRIYGKFDDHGNEVNSNGVAAADSWRQGQGGFRIDANTSPDNTFTLQGDAYGANDNGDPPGKSIYNGGNVLGRWSHTISDDSDMSLQLYYDRTHLSRPVVAGVDPLSAVPLPAGNLTDSLDTYDLDFQHRFRLATRHEITWGVGYRFTHDLVGETAAEGFFPSELDQNLFSVFAQDDLRLWHEIYFTIGTKLEHNDYTGFEVEPSARLRWNFATNQLIWAAVSRAVRTPSRIDRDLSEPSPPNPVLLRGDQGFESENVLAYEAGYRAQLGARVSSSVSVFYNQYDDVRSTGVTPTFFPFVFENDLEGHTYGVEFSADYQAAKWWRLHAGYDLIEEQLHVKAGDVDINNAENETADPRNQVFFRSSMDLPCSTELDAAFRWIDDIRNNNGSTLATVPAYAEVDVRLAWNPTKHLGFSIAGQNLVHDRHLEYGFPGPSQEEIGRSVYGKVTCRF